MIDFIDFEFYTEHGGQLTEQEYTDLSYRALMAVRMVTNDRIANVAEDDERTVFDIKSAVCAVVDELWRQDNGLCGVSSETNDGVSVSYRADARTLEKRITDLIAPYLDLHGMLYRGI